MNSFIESMQVELYRLVDPNKFSTKKDADKVIEAVEHYIQVKIQKELSDKLQEMGLTKFRADGVNYYGSKWTDEAVDAETYVEKITDNIYIVKMRRWASEEDWFANVIVDGTRVVGYGARHYRIFILDELEKFIRSQKEQLLC